MGASEARSDASLLVERDALASLAPSLTLPRLRRERGHDGGLRDASSYFFSTFQKTNSLALTMPVTLSRQAFGARNCPVTT